MLLRGWALSLLCLPACVKIPEFQHQDAAGSGDATTDGAIAAGVSAATGSGGVVLANEPLARMTFAPNGFHFPSSLLVAGRELIVTPTTACAEERAAGIALYPAVRIDNATPASVGQGSVQIDLAGPDVAKVALDWTASFPCGASTGMASGRTTFTMFADGRINRSDYVAAPGSLVAAECDCGGDDSWHVTSYFTFARDEITSTPGATPDVGLGNRISTTACATGTGFQLGMAWRTGRYARVRLPQGPTAGGTIAWVEELANPVTTLPAAFEGESQTTWWASSADTCSTLRTRVGPYQENSGDPLPALIIDGQGAGVALDGIFGGETSQAVAGRNVGTNPIVLTANVPLAGFALWVNIGAGREIASVHKAPAEPASTWYSVQTPPNKPTHRVLWFPEGLATTDTITITTQ